MAPAGRKDRGLLSRLDAAGTKVWYVRLWREGRFFPERYQHGGYDLVLDLLKHHAERRAHRRDQRSEKGFREWWSAFFKDKRLNAITPEALEQARRQLLTQGSDPSGDLPRPCSPQRVNRYLAWLRHALNVAIRDGKLSSNPVRKVTMYREHAGSTRYLTLQEEDALCMAIRPD